MFAHLIISLARIQPATCSMLQKELIIKNTKPLLKMTISNLKKTWTNIWLSLAYQSYVSKVCKFMEQINGMVSIQWQHWIDNELILTNTFSIYYFAFHEEILLPFAQVFDLTRHTFHKSIKPKMQTENLANNSHKKFCSFES